EGDPGAIRICLGAPKDLIELSDVLQILCDIMGRHPASVASVA
ncbi:PLP-dependent aminotransferase family protein, partial [Mesorhizobium sp. M4A.F.Ca.ET.022.05.2.1]